MPAGQKFHQNTLTAAGGSAADPAGEKTPLSQVHPQVSWRRGHHFPNPHSLLHALDIMILGAMVVRAVISWVIWRKFSGFSIQKSWETIFKIHGNNI